MKKTSLALVVILSLLTCALGTAATDSARVVKYAQTDIVPIRAKVRFTTLIVLPANEEILDFTVGDKDFWIVNGIHNLCYLHPAQTGIRSNMNLVTASGRVYSFLLSEISNQPDVDPDLKVFVEPKEESTIGGVSGHVEFVRASEVEAYKQEAVEARARLPKKSSRLRLASSNRSNSTGKNIRASCVSITPTNPKPARCHFSSPPSTTTTGSPTSSAVPRKSPPFTS